MGCGLIHQTNISYSIAMPTSEPLAAANASQLIM
jgi:hypothetical protein